ncbi:MAG: hypothetical protein IPO38_14430 [Rhodocyclaceae bacterium]|nr:hypothetical protein [Rhodocyclaceae bacterium]
MKIQCDADPIDSVTYEEAVNLFKQNHTEQARKRDQAILDDAFEWLSKRS